MLYLVMAMRTPNFQLDVIGPHLAFLEDLRAQGKLGLAGGFTDKSGGAYLLNVSTLDEAKAIAFSDPVHTTGSSIVTVYEWTAK